MSAENDTQKKIVAYAKSLGFLVSRRYNGPGVEVGWPDLEIFMWEGRTLFIEVKAPGAKPRKIQTHRAKQLKRLGHLVVTCTSYEEAKMIINDHS